MSWYRADVPRRLLNVGYDNYNAMIFNMPAGSGYEGYTFAHPRKITEYAGSFYTLKLHENWVFNLMREDDAGVLDEDAGIVELPLGDWARIMAEAGCLYVCESETRFWLDLLNEPDDPDGSTE